MWCRVHPIVVVVFVFTFSFVCFFSLSMFWFPPYCAIILPKNDFKTYFITTCKYQRCPIPWQKKYINVVLFLFSFFWKIAMMFMWCIVFQLVAIIKKKVNELEKISLARLLFFHGLDCSSSPLSYPRSSSLHFTPPTPLPSTSVGTCTLSRLTPIINLCYSHQQGALS